MDAAVLAAVAAEGDKARRERADWQEQRWQLEQQAAHRGREADALREACCRLKEAAVAMRQGACQYDSRQAVVEPPPRLALAHSSTQTSEAVSELADSGPGREGPLPSTARSCASSGGSGGGSSAASIHSTRPVTAVQLRLELAKLGSTTHKPITPLPVTACSRPWTASLLQRATPAAAPCLLDEQRGGYPAFGQRWGASSESPWSSLGPGSVVSTSDGGGTTEGPAASPSAQEAEAGEEEEEVFTTPHCSPRSASALDADDDACPSDDLTTTSSQTSQVSVQSWRSGAMPLNLRVL